MMFVYLYLKLKAFRFRLQIQMQKVCIPLVLATLIRIYQEYNQKFYFAPRPLPKII